MSECDNVIISKLKSYLFDNTSSGTSTIPKLIFDVVLIRLLADKGKMHFEANLFDIRQSRTQASSGSSFLCSLGYLIFFSIPGPSLPMLTSVCALPFDSACPLLRLFSRFTFSLSSVRIWSVLLRPPILSFVGVPATRLYARPRSGYSIVNSRSRMLEIDKPHNFQRAE
jgi:hypothetical protein